MSQNRKWLLVVHLRALKIQRARSVLALSRLEPVSQRPKARKRGSSREVTSGRKNPYFIRLYVLTCRPSVSKGLRALSVPVSAL